MLLFLLPIILILLLRGSNRCKKALFGYRVGELGFDSCKKLFLPSILLSILQFIKLFKLSL